MSHAIRALLALSILAAPGAALAQCTKDSDCKGDRVCERGACVSPGERAEAPPQQLTPPPPPPERQQIVRAPARSPFPPARPPGEWEVTSRKNIVAFNALATVQGYLLALQLQNNFPGLSITQFSFLYERAIAPNLSIYGVLSPNYWAVPGGNNAFYMGATLGMKFYFFNEAPSGFWIGGETGNLALDIGPGLILEGGYQFILDFGLQLGIAGGLAISQFGPGLGYGGTIGWNF